MGHRRQEANVLIFLGPVIVAKALDMPEPGPRKFSIIAYDGSCNVEIIVDEPWMSDEAIGDRLMGRDGLDYLIGSAARWLRSGGELVTERRSKA